MNCLIQRNFAEIICRNVFQKLDITTSKFDIFYALLEIPHFAKFDIVQKFDIPDLGMKRTSC